MLWPRKLCQLAVIASCAAFDKKTKMSKVGQCIALVPVKIIPAHTICLANSQLHFFPNSPRLQVPVPVSLPALDPSLFSSSFCCIIIQVHFESPLRSLSPLIVTLVRDLELVLTSPHLFLLSQARKHSILAKTSQFAFVCRSSRELLVHKAS